MWLTNPFQRLHKELKEEMQAFAFHTCMFNAPRAKRTAIWTSVRQMLQLRRDCDGQHQHAEWGLTSDNTFATAEECAYNAELAAHWAVAVSDYAAAEGIQPLPHTLDEWRHDPTLNNDHVNKAVVGMQPRGQKIPPVMTDFLLPSKVEIGVYPHLRRLSPGTRLPSEAPFPTGSRLLRFVNEEGGGCGETKHQEMTHVILGIPREPAEFVKEAWKLVHPVNQPARLPRELERALEIALVEEQGKLEMRKHRLKSANMMMQAVLDNKEEEDRLHRSLPEHLGRVMRNKKLLLFKHLLEQTKYDDAKIADEMMTGFPLNGWLPESGVFPPRLKVPEIHPDAFDEMIPSFSSRTLSAVKSSGDAELDQQLWDATCEEVQLGFVKGPFPASHLPAGALVSPRFGLKQNKLRPIDDLSISGVNMSTSLPERLKVDAIDECAAMIKEMLRRAGGKQALVGKTYDLRKAYRQLAIKEDHLRLGWIAVWSPEHRAPMVFSMDSLPFGATAAVAAFLRISRAIKFLGTTLGLLSWTAFYDDFICVCRPEDAQSTDMFVRLLFQALGWELSSGPDKDVPFGDVFSALGVQIDLRGTKDGFFEVGNTESRKQELQSRISAILESNAFTPAESMSMRSRLLFAESQIFGRYAKTALRAIGSAALIGKVERPLKQKTVNSLEWMMERILRNKPRRIDTSDKETMFLFLDGACSPKSFEEHWSGTSIGGVVFDSSGRALECFGEVLPDPVTEAWSRKMKEQLVFEAEILPYLVALSIWRELLENKLIFVFIDNEAAKSSWITGSADSSIVESMLHKGTILESRLNVSAYFCRVPTHSNVSDGPSRGFFDMCLKMGASRIAVNAQQLTELALGTPGCLK